MVTTRCAGVSSATTAEAVASAIWDAAPESLPQHSAHYRGSLSVSWTGLTYTLYDDGLEPGLPAYPWRRRRQLAEIS